MTKARILANLISDNAELADGQISVAEVVGAAPLASPTFTGTATGTFSGPLTGNVVGNLTGDVTGALTGDVTAPEIDLTAISSTIADTAVDVFVYDTSKDSDGGAWRKRTQGTSWYNETLNTSTRGSRKEFPAVAVIVLEQREVHIYDGDDPDLPMWMVFTESSSGLGSFIGYSTVSDKTSVAMKNGILAVGCGETQGNTQGLRLINFISESYNWKSDSSSRNATISNAPIVDRNSALPTGFDDGNYIVNEYVNDVAMAVLPNAPIDAATGLPVPTIAVATDGGVSVIKDDGTVVDIIDSNGSRKVKNIAFTSDDKVMFTGDLGAGLEFQAHTFVHYLPNSDVSEYDSGGTLVKQYNASTAPAINGGTTQVWANTYVDLTPTNGTGLAVGSIGAYGVSLIDDSSNGTGNNSSSFITSDYNTGWMNGNIKLATLSDTDDTDVTGSELVTNGTFDSDVSGWSNGAAAYTTFSWDAGTIEITASGGTARVNQGFAVTSGKTYTFTVTCTQKVQNSHSFVHLGTSVGGSNIINNLTQSDNAGVPDSYTFTATTSSVYIQLGAISGATVNYDNISMRLAEEDRSVNGNGLQVFGSITKDPVNTGADLVAYSGFSNLANYLEQPYNSDLDFGTGDFCVIVWVKRSSNGSFNVFASRGGGGVNNRWAIYIDSSNVLKAAIREVGEDTITGSTLPQDTWTHAALVRRNGVGYFYINGVLSASASANRNLTNTVGTLKVGVDYDTSTAAANGSVALLRVSATAPSPEQIAKIYEDEKVLFQENAQATLYGSSDTVTALAYDDSTELLHVGTSAGRSVFHGLRRVDNTTDAVGAAISASNGLVAED